MAQKEKKKALYTVGRAILKPFFLLIYRLKITGTENIPKEGPVIICCNHLAQKDPVLLGVAVPRQLAYMAKAELFKFPLLKFLFKALGAYPVSRGTGGEDGLREAYRVLEEGRTTGIFIEGHRSKDGELQKPKTGAALIAYKTGAPVVPACITGHTGSFSKPFRTTLINFGKPIYKEDLNIESETGMHMRKGSRVIMEKITDLREQALKELHIEKKDGASSCETE